jgi:hypothetical protein
MATSINLGRRVAIPSEPLLAGSGAPFGAHMRPGKHSNFPQAPWPRASFVLPSPDSAAFSAKGAWLRGNRKSLDAYWPLDHRSPYSCCGCCPMSICRCLTFDEIVKPLFSSSASIGVLVHSTRAAPRPEHAPRDNRMNAQSTGSSYMATVLFRVVTRDMSLHDDHHPLAIQVIQNSLR